MIRALAQCVSATARPSGRTLGIVVRHQAGAAAATLVDFSSMIVGVDALGLRPVTATALGATAGAVMNFILARRWIFRATWGRPAGQALRYAMVAAGGLAFNTAG